MGDALESLPDLSDDIVRLVVVSDVHAVPSGAGAVVAQNVVDNTANALTAALALFADRGIKADVLACPGDLIHAGNAGAAAVGLDAA